MGGCRFLPLKHAVWEAALSSMLHSFVRSQLAVSLTLTG